MPHLSCWSAPGGDALELQGAALYDLHRAVMPALLGEDHRVTGGGHHRHLNQVLNKRLENDL